MAATPTLITSFNNTSASITVSSGTEMLVVVIATEGSGITEADPGVTWNGTAMTLRVARTSLTATTTEQGLAIFTLASPAIGTFTLSSTGWNGTNCIKTAIEVRGIHATTPIGNTGKGSSSTAQTAMAFDFSDASTDAGVSLTTAGANSLIIAALTGGNTLETTDIISGWTSLADEVQGANSQLDVQYLADSGAASTNYGSTSWPMPSSHARPTTVQLEIRAASTAESITVTDADLTLTAQTITLVEGDTPIPITRALATVTGQAVAIADVFDFDPETMVLTGQEITVSDSGSGAPPSWVLTGAVLDIDFENNRIYDAVNGATTVQSQFSTTIVTSASGLVCNATDGSNTYASQAALLTLMENPDVNAATVLVTFTSAATGTFPVIYSTATTTQNRLLLYSTDAYKLTWALNSIELPRHTTVTADTRSKAATTWDATSGLYTHDGEAAVTHNTTPPTADAANIYWGNRGDNLRPLQGHIHRITIWNVKKTGAEIEALTADDPENEIITVDMAELALNGQWIDTDRIEIDHWFLTLDGQDVTDVLGDTVTVSQAALAVTGQAISDSDTVPGVPVAFVAANAGNLSQVAEPAHAAGDYLILVSNRDGSNTLQTVPVTYTTLETHSGSGSMSALVAYRIGDGTPVTLTVTNSTGNVCAAYSGVSAIGDTAVATSFLDDSIDYPALTLVDTGGTSWVVLGGTTRLAGTTSTMETPPTGFTNRATSSDGTDEAVIHDSAGGKSSWAGVAQSIGGTTGHVGFAVELRAAPVGDTPVTAAVLSLVGQEVNVFGTELITAGMLQLAGSNIVPFDPGSSGSTSSASGGGSGGPSSDEAYYGTRKREQEKREREERLWKGEPARAVPDKAKESPQASAEVKETLLPEEVIDPLQALLDLMAAPDPILLTQPRPSRFFDPEDDVAVLLLSDF